MQINRNTYYYWLKIQDRVKQEKEKYLLQEKRIIALCELHEKFYGFRKITFLYQRTFNETIKEHKVYQIMRKNNVSCCLRIKKNKYNYQTMKSQMNIANNLINQDFQAHEPMKKLFTDITYFKTQNRFLYFSCIIDAFNKQIVAYHVSNKQNKDLILNTI